MLVTTKRSNLILDCCRRQLRPQRRPSMPTKDFVRPETKKNFFENMKNKNNKTIVKVIKLGF